MVTTPMQGTELYTVSTASFMVTTVLVPSGDG
jgi:hypothetical protein